MKTTFSMQCYSCKLTIDLLRSSLIYQFLNTRKHRLCNFYYVAMPSRFTAALPSRLAHRTLPETITQHRRHESEEQSGDHGN